MDFQPTRVTLQRALFVTHRNHIGAGKGGVQVCTQEYLRVLEAAGVSIDVIEIMHDTALTTRVVRRLYPSPYFRSICRRDIRRIAQHADTTRAEAILFNQVALCSSIAAIRQLERSSTKKMALSHGCEITDLLHIARLRRELPISARLGPSSALAVGSVLMDEMRARRELDGVVTLSPFDAATETWMGAPRVAWLPRTIAVNPLDWKPQGALFGFVGTLDHAPNLEGLLQVLEALGKPAEKNLRLRIVGGPEDIGRWLAGRFDCIDYLGRLDDDALRAEAATWSAFLNPIFCQARGCSTKLAQALAWGIPIITTEYGRRGYTWSAGACIEANTPALFAKQMYELCDETRAGKARAGVLAAASSGPTLQQVAAKLRAFLSEVMDPTSPETRPID